MSSENYELASDIGLSPEAEARRWKLELTLAANRERRYRDIAKDIYDSYTPQNPKSNSFNILFPNTETLRQSVLNSLPQPDVRRRYSDADPVGKAVSECLTRALEFSQECYDEFEVLQKTTLSMLLGGRGVIWMRYKPSIDDETDTVAWESVEVEFVQYDDFRILCEAKSWAEVTAIGRRHSFTRQECIDKFGEDIGNEITLEAPSDKNDTFKNTDGEVFDLFKRAEIWEIWVNEDGKREVIWISPNGHAKPCKKQDDPLKLQNFWPCPRPWYAVERDDTLVPMALYTQYEQQAKELNRISIRINKLTEMLKVRGFYGSQDVTADDFSKVMSADDGTFVGVTNPAALAESGGIANNIWFMPLDVIAGTLKELYVQRDQTKAIIYEITGISDIMRSASDPNETFGAQKIKTQWGTQRLQRMQREGQRFIRDMLRIKSEIIAEHFQPTTLEQMTMLDLPHDIDVQHQYTMAALQAQQANQPPPPPPQGVVTWEKVMQTLKDDKLRTYKIDVETDSTIAATQDGDIAGLREVLSGIADLFKAFGPAVQQGAMSIDLLKQLMLVVCRRAKMGMVIEDVIEKIQQPPPPKDPEAGKAQAAAQLEQMKAQIQDASAQKEMQLRAQMDQQKIQADQQAAQYKASLDAQVATHAQQVQAAQNQHEQNLEAQRAQLQNQHAMQMQQMQSQFDAQKAQLEANVKLTTEQMKNATAIEVAELGAATTLQAAQVSAAKQAESGGNE